MTSKHQATHGFKPVPKMASTETCDSLAGYWHQDCNLTLGDLVAHQATTNVEPSFGSHCLELKVWNDNRPAMGFPHTSTGYTAYCRAATAELQLMERRR